MHKRFEFAPLIFRRTQHIEQKVFSRFVFLGGCPLLEEMGKPLNSNRGDGADNGTSDTY